MGKGVKGRLCNTLSGPPDVVRVRPPGTEKLRTWMRYQFLPPAFSPVLLLALESGRKATTESQPAVVLCAVAGSRK
jgi:hypothetical protein